VARALKLAYIPVFASFDLLQTFKTKFNAQTVALQGSGWGWLAYDKASDTVKIATTPNQDPLFLSGLVPILGIDVWE
jgi:Fe-Mn family superoxide dismutase